MVRKHQGIIQMGGNKGRLKKGYRYSGQKLKSGIPEIVKVKGGMLFNNILAPPISLNNELKILGKDPIKNEIEDTLVLARNKFPGSSSSLDALCKRYRIDNSRRTLHTALIDCDLLTKVYINLIDQKEPTLNFQNKDLKLKDEIEQKVDYCRTVVALTDEELNDHRIYLKRELKKNFFN